MVAASTSSGGAGVFGVLKEADARFPLVVVSFSAGREATFSHSAQCRSTSYLILSDAQINQDSTTSSRDPMAPVFGEHFYLFYHLHLYCPVSILPFLACLLGTMTLLGDLYLLAWHEDVQSGDGSSPETICWVPALVPTSHVMRRRLPRCTFMQQIDLP